jgi:hypothetical protein
VGDTTSHHSVAAVAEEAVVRSIMVQCGKMAGSTSCESKITVIANRSSPLWIDIRTSLDVMYPSDESEETDCFNKNSNGDWSFEWNFDGSANNIYTLYLVIASK